MLFTKLLYNLQKYQSKQLKLIQGNCETEFVNP